MGKQPGKPAGKTIRAPKRYSDAAKLVRGAVSVTLMSVLPRMATSTGRDCMKLSEGNRTT